MSSQLKILESKGVVASTLFKIGHWCLEIKAVKCSLSSGLLEIHVAVISYMD